MSPRVRFSLLSVLILEANKNANLRCPPPEGHFDALNDALKESLGAHWEECLNSLLDCLARLLNLDNCME